MSVWTRPLVLVETCDDDHDDVKEKVDDDHDNVKEMVDDQPVKMKTKWREVITECNIVLFLIAAFSLIFLAVRNILTS